MSIFNKINVYIIGFFLASAFFFVSGSVAMAAETVDPASPVPEGTSGIIITSTPYSGTCRFGSSCEITFAGVTICQSSGVDLGPFDNVVAGTYTTFHIVPNPGSADCTTPSMFPEDVNLDSPYVVSSNVLTPAQQSTQAITQSGEATLGVFYSSLPTILTLVAALLITLWGVGWVTSKMK